MKKILALLLVLCLMVGMMPAALAAGSYVDVPTNEWYADEVAYVTEKGLMDGIDNGEFGPDVDVSRAMVVTILHRVEGEPAAAASPFADVPANEWYTKAVAWAAANGIVDGVSDTRFAPTEDITREQLAAILYRYADYKGYDVSARANLGAYADAGKISSWALAPMQWAVAVGLIDGVTETALQPAGTANRAQLAAIIYRFCNNVSAGAGEDKTDTYTVTFMLNYGTAAEYTSVEVEAGAKVAAPANPTRSGYSFRAWCTDTAGNSRYNFNAPVESDLTLYASWNKQSTGGGSIGHTHRYTVEGDVITPATCITDGEQTWKCSCGNASITKPIPAPGHSFGEWSEVTPATCSTTGEQNRTCTVCSEVETDIIDALDHIMVNGDKVEGNSCSGAVYEWTCSRGCGYTENRAESAEGHTEGTLTKIDEKTHGTKCSECQAVITTEEHSMKIVGGDESSWECESCGYAVTYEAKIGTEYYATVADALVEAVSGDTITLLKNITLSEDENKSIALNKAVVFEGNDKTITVTCVNDDDAGYAAVSINAAGVTVQNVTFDGLVNGGKDDGAVWVTVDGTETTPIQILDCTFTGGENSGVTGIITPGDVADYLVVNGNTFTNLKYAAYFNGIAHGVISENKVDGTQYNAFNVAAGSATFTANEMTGIASADDTNAYGDVYNSAICVQSGTITVHGDNEITMAQPETDKPVHAADGTTVNVKLAAGEFKLNEQKLELGNKTIIIEGAGADTKLLNGHPADGENAAIGVYGATGGTLTVKNVSISGTERATNGLTISGNNNQGGLTLNVEGVTFTSLNTGIVLSAVKDANIKNCTFTDCAAAMGGTEQTTGTVTVDTCTFTDNSENIGWAPVANTAKLVVKSSPTLTYFNCYHVTDIKNPNVVPVKDGACEYTAETCHDIIYIADGFVLNKAREYEISNVNGLVYFADSVNADTNNDTYSGKTVKLVADIDLKDVAWTPIGNVNSYPSVTFAGTFDGHGHTISNMTANAEGDSGVASAGLFGSITGKVKNVILDKATVTSTHYAGGIVGYSSSNVGMEISGCTVKNSTITTKPEEVVGESGKVWDNGDKAGGIIGYCVAGDVVTGNTVINTTVKGYRDIGGIAGRADGTVINNSVEDVTVVQDNTNGYKSETITTMGAVIGGGTASENTVDGFELKVKFVAGNSMDAIIGLNADTIEVTLTGDVTLLGSDTGCVLGGNDTETITINGGDNTITLRNAPAGNEGYNWVRINTVNAKLILNNLNIKDVSENVSTWDAYDITFICDTEMNTVKFEQAVALNGGTYMLNKVTINETNDKQDAYALWIVHGSNVTLKDCVINGVSSGSNNNRAIKIADQYADDVTGRTILNVSGTTFKSEKKAAVLVTSNNGVDIMWGEGNDISDVVADTTNAVWVDNGSNYGERTLNTIQISGATAVVES